MKPVQFTREEKDLMIEKIREYLLSELDVEVGGFDAEFLIDFISKELGPFFYNRGLYDARALVSAKLTELDDAIYDIEQPVDKR